MAVADLFLPLLDEYWATLLVISENTGTTLGTSTADGVPSMVQRRWVILVLVPNCFKNIISWDNIIFEVQYYLYYQFKSHCILSNKPQFFNSSWLY